MHKNCKKCSADFTIEKEDTKFYERMKVPEPTFCPLCRMQRRMAFRNERNLYKRKCDLTGKDVISVYPPDSKYTIYNQKDWWGDKWNPLDYGKDFDFNRSFFDQLSELLKEVPRICLQNRNNENSDYGSDSNDLKNCYLCFNSEQAEDSYYCTTYGLSSKDNVDLFWCMGVELCYECTKVMESYNCRWCYNLKNSSDCFFCEDLLGCSDCFGCIGLRRKKYCIYNEQKTKEEYEQFIDNFDFSYSNIEKEKKKLEQLRLEVPCKNLQISSCENCEGDYIENSKNVTESFDILQSENVKYVWDGIINNGMDCFNTGIGTDFVYECVGVYYANNIKFCDKCHNSSDLEYCDYCFQCEHMFGCVGLSHKKYCILNKQYSREDYFVLRDKIINHMKKTGEYGEFFPASLSPYGYNDTVANDYFPLSREKALGQGFSWNDYKNPKPEGIKTVKAKDLPENIQETPGNCTNWVIECEKDKEFYKIIPQEFNFYKKHNIPLPHLCPDCRYYEKKWKVNPRKLWERDCDRCHKGIKTNYAAERREKVYCEKCYLDEIV